MKRLGLLCFSALIWGCSERTNSESISDAPSNSQAEGFKLASVTTVDINDGTSLSEFSLIQSESFGGLKLDMNIQEFESLLPCRVEKSEPVLWAGIGEIIQEWNYQDCGVKLQLSTVDPDTPQIISSIVVRAPSELQTSRGIKVGSSEAAVIEAYADYLDDDHSVSGDTLVAGSVYGGLIFTIRNDQVDTMFLGAGAE